VIDFIPPPAGPFALARLPAQLEPGHAVWVAGRPTTIAGAIVCVDRVEAWLECLLHPIGEPAHWLAVEVRDGRYRTTMWQRSVEAEMPAALRADDAATLVGTASFRGRGDFGGYPIPETGLLSYREAPGLVPTAAEQFTSGGPWLVGRGDGVDIDVKAPDPAADEP
jgi:hypothetical protein